jgi:tetratricopeptide (TPR) repeat protein
MVAGEGAHLLMLDVLTPPEAFELLSRTAGVQRVNAEPEAAAEVVRLCGCLPLAVRIAGARLATRPGMSLPDLAERLSDERGRLGELSAGDLGVRASFALSYHALDPAAAQMFRRLGLIPGPDFAPDVTAALTNTSPEEAETLLEALVDAHLVEMPSTPGRYRFHDLLRLYAQERLQTDETGRNVDDTLRRMFDWYLDRADAAESFFIPGRRRLPYKRTGKWENPAFSTFDQALTWFEAERGNLVAATRQAANHRIHPTAWQLADALWGFLSLRSYWSDWYETHSVGLQSAREAGDRPAEAWLLTSLGHMHAELNQFIRAGDLTQESLAIFRELGDQEGAARALTGLGRANVGIRRFEQAVQCQQEALAICIQIGYPYRQGVALEDVGVAYRSLHRFEEAIDCYQRALLIRHSLGHRWGGDGVLLNLGEVYDELGRFDEAIDCYRQALTISRQTGYRLGEGQSLDLLGRALRHTQGVEAARPCWQEALAIFTELGAPHAEEVRARLAENPQALKSNT